MYLIASLAIWGMPVLAHLRTRYVAAGRGDPDFYRWALAWTPWALSHGHSPFFTDRVFAPTGTNLSWVAMIPGPSIVMWPITSVYGSLASYNVLMLTAPALAGWAAYLVCHRITKAYWPSFVGGFLFGFSTFVTGQLQGHVNLVLIFPVPLLVYLVIRVTEGSIGSKAFVALLVPTLLGLFSISSELFATTTLFGVVAFAIAIVLAGPDRERVVHAVVLSGLAYVVVVVLLLVPIILPAIRSAPGSSIRPIDRASADLFGFVVPRENMLIGGSAFAPLSDRFTAHAAEDGSYIGIALVLMVAGFWITQRGRRETWGLVGFFLVVSILALGPVLHVAGRSLFRLPGSALGEMPLLKNATPDRFPAYSALAVAVIAALWLARARGRSRLLRWAIVGIGASMLLVSVHAPPWYPDDRTPAFFADGSSGSILRHDEDVLLITGSNGEEMLWQERAGFGFRMPEGYVGSVPFSLRGERLNRGLAVEDRVPFMPTSRNFARWIAEHEVTAIVIGASALERFEPLVRSVRFQPVYTGGGVSVWRQRSVAGIGGP